jgi:hypothetical protein
MHKYQIDPGGLYPIPWGARWAPPRSQVPSNAICHQKSTCNSAGSPVGSLPHPRATPRGWAARPCRASASLALFFFTHPARACACALRLGIKDQRPPAPR